MKAKNWSALHLAQRRRTLSDKIARWESACAQIGEPQDRHQRRSLTVILKSLKAAREELLLVGAREES